MKNCPPLALLLALCVRVGAMDLPHPVTSGPNPDFPPFVTETNGVFQMPWGGSYYSWPEQMFWRAKSEIRDKRQEMLQATAGVESQGLVPVMSCVAWGYEYTAATGGDSALGLGDMSHKEGWQQWGEWLTARKDKYIALDLEGKVFYPSAGYVTPLMPLDSADWPAGIRDATYGDWAGERLGSLANELHVRGFMAADFVVGLYGANHDFHPRVIDDFEKWAGVSIPGATVHDRSSVIQKQHWPVWQDFKAHRFARFYARAAETIRAAGREPLVGGQILPYAASARSTGNDFRIYLEHLPAKNWYFQVELQSDEGRPVPPYWSASTNMGGQAARAPDFRFGAHMDAYQSNFAHAVQNAGKDGAWGWSYLRHQWLSVGWTHIANTDGSVRRAPQAFQRTYWDAGAVDTPVVALVRAHIPKHPFGPAFYYSTDLERQSENTGSPNFFYWFEPRVLGWRLAGVPGGYFVSDTALERLEPVNRPSGWFVYVDNLGMSHLSDRERQRLEAIAPILDESQVRDSCPLSFEGDSLGGFGFIDQNGSVIAVVSNQGEAAVDGALHFAKVENGNYLMTELLAGGSFGLEITGHKGSVPVRMEGRETRVYRIDGLRELGRKDLLPWTGPNYVPPVRPGVLRPEGRRLDILGRRFETGPGMVWSAPAP